jgi:hypothetical protein
VQDLGKGGLHARALSCGQDHDVRICHCLKFSSNRGREGRNLREQFPIQDDNTVARIRTLPTPSSMVPDC